MKISKNFEAEIVDLGTNGNGVTKKDGIACFVPYTITGEKVLLNVNKIEKNFCICTAEKIISPSKNRILPNCPYFGKCGGCQLQHISKQTQLEYKTKQIKTILEKNLHQNIDVLPCISENDYNYRNKINFSIFQNRLCFSDNDNNFFAVSNCPLFVCDLTQIIYIFNNYLEKNTPNLKALHIRILNNVYQFTFVSNNINIPNFDELIDNLKNININFSLNFCINKIKNSSNIMGDIKCVYGDEKLDYENFGVKSKISPESFLQVNEKVQNKIYENINNKISNSNNVINAYGGTGILSSIISKKAKTVYSIEINKQASKNCQEMVDKNKINNVAAICGDCKIEIPKLLETQNISHIIFDPPRSGIDNSILECVKKLNIENIIYLSCNPSTLARDLKILSDKYEVINVQPYDMFPQTYHIETLVFLKLKNILKSLY